jgi:(1->4)-alpha-D-glucan 1-alpha-D-glucosylmutase
VLNKYAAKPFTGTYRIQLTPDFGFDKCAKIISYLRKLGISHIYLSPVFQAEKGSTSGYDVVDCRKINEELGGEKEFYKLIKKIKPGMGFILDIVPNHASIKSGRNMLWMDVLKKGPKSRYAHFFDIDWDPPQKKLHGKVLLPILGNHYKDELETGHIKIERVKRDFFVSYYEFKFPINSPGLKKLKTGTSRELEKINKDPKALDEILSKQFYFLSHWESADKEINYRRFFSINHLAGLCIEENDVFQYVHKNIFLMLRNGIINGLRIDHIDGLRDPQEYLIKLKKKSLKTWIVVEKILGSDERIPDDWPINGTTGYDFLNVVNGLFVNPSAHTRLSDFYRKLTGETRDFGELLRKKKLLTLEKSFGGESARLLKILESISLLHHEYKDLTIDELHDGLINIISCFPVYRTYINNLENPINLQDKKIIEQAISTARDKNPTNHPIVWSFFSDLLLGNFKGCLELEFIFKFQQLTGPVMAKGAEDTAFYCFNDLISLNEVGGEPSKSGTSVNEFHRYCHRIQRDWPLTMLTTSTHDTKRGEDVRMRINMISEIPDQWQKNVLRWFEMNKQFHSGNLPDANTEYLLYQTLVGSWPIEQNRIKDYMIKAAREEKVHTNWTNVKDNYEQSLINFIESIYNDHDFVNSLQAFIKIIIAPAQISSLSQTLIKYTSPGIPDIYQGTELWDISLVDPDNRRPVDFKLREKTYSEMENMSAAQALKNLDSGLAKMYVIHKCLNIRKKYFKSFGENSNYAPLEITGSKSEHILGFCRNGNIITIAPRLLITLNKDWQAAAISLPAGKWKDEFTKKEYENKVEIAGLLEDFPLSLLIKENK